MPHHTDHQDLPQGTTTPGHHDAGVTDYHRDGVTVRNIPARWDNHHWHAPCWTFPVQVARDVAELFKEAKRLGLRDVEYRQKEAAVC